MTDYHITVDVDSYDEANAVIDKIKKICQDIIEEGGKEAEKFAKTILPKRTGRLAGATKLTLDKNSFQLVNNKYYGPFVDQGHREVVHHRGHPPHQVGYFSGEHFSEKIWQHVKDDIDKRCKAFLDLK